MSILSEIRSHPKRFYNTLGLFWVFISHGLLLGIIGPTILDLRIACDTDVGKITYVMTGRAGGYAVGSFVTAFIYSRLDVPVSIAIGTFISAGIVFAIPFVRNVYVLIGTFFILGSNMGIFEAAINVFLIDLWGKENPPFMQMLHFCYGFGALISPLFAKPFLLESEFSDDEDEKNFANETSRVSLFDASLVDSEKNFQFSKSTHSSHPQFTADDLLIVYPYSIIAICMVVSCIVFTLIRVYFRVNTHIHPHPSRATEQLCQHFNQSTNQIGNCSTSCNEVQLKSPKLPPHVARIMKDQINHPTNNSSVTSTSSNSKCTKCHRVRRFTFTNHGNSLSIVSNSSSGHKLPTSARVFNLSVNNNSQNQVGEISGRGEDAGHILGSKVNSPFASPLASPIGSPYATPLFKSKFDHLRTTQSRTQSVTSGCSQCRPKNHESQVAKSVPGPNNETLPVDSSIGRYKILVVVLCGFFMHFYCATEMTFGSFVSPFAVKSDLHMSKKSAAILSSVFWASFTFYRLIMVFLVEFLGNRNSVLVDVLLCLVSNIFLVPFGDKHEWCLWTGTALMGIGLSAIWASIIGYIEEYMPVTSRIMAVFMITACVGQVFLPAIISPFMETYPKALIWVSFSYSIAMVVFFLLITLVCTLKLVKDTPKGQKVVSSH